jgi:hypothetical protein
VDLGATLNAVEEPKDLILDVQLSGVDSVPFTKNGMRVGETATFPIKSGNGQVEIDLTFHYDGARPYLEVNAFTYRKVLVFTNNRQQKEELKSLAENRIPAYTIPLEELRFSTIVADFERIAKSADGMQKGLSSSQVLTTLERVEIPRKNREIASKRDDLEKAKKDGDSRKQALIMREIANLESAKANMVDVVDKYKDRINQYRMHIPWTQEMQKHFEELGKSARIGYSLYIMINGEKVYLAQTEFEQPTEKKAGPEKRDANEKNGQDKKTEKKVLEKKDQEKKVLEKKAGPEKNNQEKEKDRSKDNPSKDKL